MNDGYKKGFVFSFNYPPRVGGESIVTYKLLKSSKFTYDIYSSTFQKKRVDFQISANNINSYKTNSRIFWMFKALLFYYKQAKKTQYSFMMSRSMPVTSHIPALIIKLLNRKMVWIASISDPIYNSPYVSSSSVLKKIFDKIEASTYKYADRIIFTNEYMMEYILNRKYFHYMNKSSVVPFGFEAIDESNNDCSKSDNIVISHVGAFYGDRNPGIILEALAKYIKSGHAKKKIILQFVGNVSEEIKNKSRQLNIEDHVEFVGVVDYYKSIEYMKKASILLILDAEFDNLDHSVFLPSKIYDYIGAIKPIVAIGNNNGPVNDIIKDTGNVMIRHNFQDIYSFIEKIDNCGIHKPNYSNCEKYSIALAAKKLDEIINFTINGYGGRDER